MAKKMAAAGRPARTSGKQVPPRKPGALSGLPTVRARAQVDQTWNATGKAAPPLPSTK